MDEQKFPALTRREIFKVLWGGVPPSFVAPALLTLALTIAFIVVAERNYRNIVFSVNERRLARDNLDVIDELQTTLLNAETSQRGYLLTSNKDYLQPLVSARTELPKLQSRAAVMFGVTPARCRRPSR